MKKTSLITLLMLVSLQMFGQQFWNKQDVNNFQRGSEELNERKTHPNTFDLYTIDLSSFDSYLRSRSPQAIVEFPDGNGKLQKFRIIETSNFEPALAAKFPMIKSYTGYGIDDPTAMAKIDIGTRGLHVVVFSGEASTLFIDPYTKDGSSYMVYHRSDLNDADRHFSCELESISIPKNQGMPDNSMRNADDGLLRTFRIAIAATGEYSTYHLNQQGVSSGATDAVKKAAVLSAMNTTMNRVNGVYEKDLGVHMNIVANNDVIIFLNAATDGLSNNSASALIGQSQTVCDSQIGSANYDVGHTFSTGGGGLAGLGVVCINGQKARGITGLGNPINDPYDIDYVAHELGHQFGANHTQNNSCQRNGATAVEPGSASTIMGYAGICAPNVQNNSDDHFHAVSIGEMWNVLQSSATCSVNTNTGNSAPTADAGADVSIPKSTPFVLRGIATDADGLSSLTYNWEQIDNEIGSMPPSSTNTQGPMFRSLSSKTVPDRYMPDLATVISGSTSSTWEVVPSVARDMEFAFTVRDNNSGGGNSARDDKIVTVVDINPFTVSSQATAVTYAVGSSQTITWNKGTTDVAPVNCQLVNIKLSTDGGLTFPITVLANTPNDGSEDIVIPNTPSTMVRVMVEAADNIFYNVNATNFTIEGSTPTFVASNTSGTQEACNTPSDTVDYTMLLEFVNGFSETVSFSASGLPTGAQVNFSPSTVSSTGNVTATVSNLDGASAQNYTITVTATSASITRQVELPLVLYSTNFATINLTSPANGDQVTTTPTLTWSNDANATSYSLEVATDNAFSNIVISATESSNTYAVTSGLASNTTYYWRVKPTNSCGEGAFSSTGNFETTCDYCASTGNTQFETAVTLVTFNTINNASTKGTGYEDNTAISTTVQRDDTYQLTVNLATDGNYTIHAKAWIDWNKNCVFDANEEYDLGTAVNTDDGPTNLSPLSITVPSDAAFGSTRMRVSCRYNVDPTVCATNYDGEVEDYTIIVDAPASVGDEVLNNFQMYPNPTQGSLNIAFDLDQGNKVGIQFYDLRGRLVKNFNYENATARFSETLNTNEISSGIYLVKIQNGQKSTVKKVIVE